MADREKILRYFKAGGDEQLAAKLLDLAEGANKSRKFRVSEFLDPHAYNVAEIIAANYENVRLESDEVAEVESHFLVAELHPGVKQVLQLGKVGVAYFLPVVILVGVHIVYHNQSVL